MDSQEMKVALRSGRPVTWRGKFDYERATGTLTAIILRHINGRDILSAEITELTRGCIVTCRADEVEYWRPAQTEENKEGI